jgi:RNA polymerase sigma-70 factor (ECF subfamily)
LIFSPRRKTPWAVSPSLLLRTSIRHGTHGCVESTLPIVKQPGDLGPTSRDRQEFVALLDAHGAALLATTRRLCGNNHDADDLFQETAVRVWRIFGSRPWLRSPRAWLITIAYRTFLDDRKRVRRCTTDQPDDFIDYRIASPERQLEQAEACAQLNQRVDELPPEIRLVVTLHYTGGLTIRQTAAAMGTSLAITKNRLHLALKQLRSALE